MSGPGPPYPRYVRGAGPGQNYIGAFIIGVSPIGDVSPFDIWTTCINQYANSTTIDALITNMAQYVDPTANFDAFYDTIWNADTAVGAGLDTWGNIVGVRRTFQALSTVRNLGFEEATDANADPFNQSPFYGGPTLENTFSLTDAQFRPLVFAKALSNISDGSIPSINQLILNLFPNRGNCYVVDSGDMTMSYTFAFPLSSQEYAMLAQSGVLPRPPGVYATIVQLT
jgi:hypothetical protein